MSGNINDTDVIILQKEVDSLLHDLDELTNQNESIVDWETTLENRYKKLSKTSETLFKFITKNYTKAQFDIESFRHTLSLMLKKITSIQKGESSQHEASINVGNHLADKFIPQLKK